MRLEIRGCRFGCDWVFGLGGITQGLQRYAISLNVFAKRHHQPAIPCRRAQT